MSKAAREMRMLKQWLGLPLRAKEDAEREDTETDEEVNRYPRFYEGRRYRIEDGDKTSTFLNPMTGTGCVYRYEGKSGIHYCFREERGGWTRTYTAAQLVGKRIQEEM